MENQEEWIMRFLSVLLKMYCVQVTLLSPQSEELLNKILDGIYMEES